MKTLLSLIALAIIPSIAQAQFSYPDPPVIMPKPIGRNFCSINWYPRDLMMEHVEGVVVVEFNVDLDGTAKDAAVLKSSGNSELDEAAIKCVSHFRFTPAMKGGQPVPMAKIYATRFCHSDSCRKAPLDFVWPPEMAKYKIAPSP